MNITEILQNFEMDKPKRTVFGNYRIENDKLIYRAQVSQELRADGETLLKLVAEYQSRGFKLVGRDKKPTDKPTWGCWMVGYETDTVAIKIKRGDKLIRLGNGSVLSLIGRVVAYGNERRNRGVTDIQNEMRGRGYIMVPFSVFEAADLDIKTFELVEQGPEETLKVKVERGYDYNTGKNRVYIENRHFVGASLFQVGGKSFLFDIDRREIRHKIFNPFLVELKGTPKNITAAYESLKPSLVKKAEADGLKVLRQGEWFFVPTKAPKLIKLTDKQKIELLLGMSWDRNSQLKYIGDGYKAISRDAKIRDQIPQAINLRAGNNRPNSVQTGLKQDGKVFCTGKVSHSGREHADLVLKGWYLAVPNTSVGSFTLTGDVD